MNTEQQLQQLDELDKSIINLFQDGFPLVSRPFKSIADQCSVSETEVISRLKCLKKRRILSRIGAVIRPNTIGNSTLCAMAVPEDRIDQVAKIINTFKAVNHNYLRSHEFNLWFVVTASSQDQLSQILDKITDLTGIGIINLPLKTAYYLNLGFKID